MLHRAARYRNWALLKATLLLVVAPLILYAFSSAGNTANGNGNTTGDDIFTRSKASHPTPPPPPPPPPGSAPSINAGGIVNAATFVVAPNNTAAPGALISIFGVDLAAELGTADQLPLPEEALLQKSDSIPNALPPDRLGDGQKRLHLPI